MRIEQITLQGFKSFGERTRLDFGPSVTGVVGPNGSGKSNLVEALRWIVGARARELRGEEAQALLFHGSEGRAPMGFAEVELVLSRGRERLVISRRLDRDGASDVRLSGHKATFKAIERALAGSGLARGGYAIIGQGEVGEVLQAGPEVLLGYLEEAAGLKAVTLATRTAEERLEAATQEMEALSRKHAELKEGLQAKAAQAEAARRARELSRQLLALKRGLVQARIQESQAEARKTQARLVELEAEKAQLAERLAALQQEKTALQEGLEGLNRAHGEALRQAEALQGERRLLEQETAHLRELEARLRREAEGLGAQVARFEALPVPQEPQTPEPGAQQVEGLELRQRQTEARLAELQRELRQAQARYEAFLKAQATYEARLAAFRQTQEQQQHLEAERSRLEGALAELEARRQGLEAREQQLRAELDRVVKQEGGLGADLRASRSEAQRLEAYLQSGTDLAEGPRKARNAGIAGVLGVVADLLEVPEGLELALEIALGGRLQWVLTRDERAAKQAVDYLKREGGRATFLPLTLLKPAHRPRRDWSQLPGVRGLARELVGFAHPEALPTLLGDTLVLESLEAALTLARQHPDHPRLVTLEGELLESSGAITGGRVQRGGQMLAQRRRLAEVRGEAEALTAQVQALSARAAELRQQLQDPALKELRQQEDAARVELRGVRLALERLGNPQPPEAPEPVPAPDTQAPTALADELEALRQELARLREARLAWTRYREQARAYREAQENRQRAAERLQAIALELEGLEQRRRAAAERLGSLEQEAAALGLSALEAALQQARQRARTLAEEESRLLARTNAVLGELEQARISLARRESTQEALLLELAELPEGPTEEGHSRALARRLSETEAALEALGAVNHLAESEYQALAQEAEQLAGALAEAEAGVAKLEAELRLVEGEYRDRLHAAFHRFRDRFHDYARALLGAEARVEHDKSGLHLVLQPSGKRTIDLGLLSMGERTMGALAFLFALAGTAEEGRGLPIAVLDEVDAPLDEANILRFTEFLQRFKGETQFILITHQKRTMEACDALYGVTSERGLSRVYSIRREDALA